MVEGVKLEERRGSIAHGGVKRTTSDGSVRIGPAQERAIWAQGGGRTGNVTAGGAGGGRRNCRLYG
jgi:hypothetical protein